MEADGLGSPVIGIPYSVQAGYGRYDDYVTASGHEGAGSTEAQLFYLVVDAQVFLDIGIGCRQICLRLIVVVV